MGSSTRRRKTPSSSLTPPTSALSPTRPLPRSIYEVEGAKEVAIEFCSFSKTAGFTGTRCGYTVVPKALVREGAELNGFLAPPPDHQVNGVPYIVQRGGGSGLHRGGPGPDESEHRLLPPERQGPRGHPRFPRRPLHRRQKLPLYLDGVPLRDEELGLLRTCCWRRPGSSARRAPGSAKTAKGSSGSPPLTTMRTPPKRRSG